MGKRWSITELNDLKAFYPSKDKQWLESYFSRDWRNIKDKAYKERIRKLIGNEGVAVLLNDSLQTMYWIGFLLADGHFTDTRVSVELSIKDMGHLKSFASYINTDNWYERVRVVNNKEYKQCSTNVTNIAIIPKIVSKFTIQTNKTINPPNLKALPLTVSQLISLFIGFVDGDGSIYTPTYSEKLRIECHKNWADNLLFFENLLYETFEVPKLVTQLTKISSRDTAVLEISSTTMLRTIKRFIKENNLSVMNRKWDKVK